LILYLDTSSLVKLYVEEPGSPAVHAEVDGSELVATSTVAYAEARAALARRRREGSLTAAEHRKAKAGLDTDWPRVLTVVQEFPAEPVRFSTADVTLARAARRTTRRLSARRE
jgi:uncharacterized protein with PIN domain